MNINRIMPTNTVMVNNQKVKVEKQLNYNQYLINIDNERKIINIKDIELIPITEQELEKMNYIYRNNKYVKQIDEEKEIIIELDNYELDYEDIVGIDNYVPNKYSYLHQIQNLESYVL